MKKILMHLTVAFVFLMLCTPMLVQAQPNLGMNYAGNFGLQSAQQTDRHWQNKISDAEM